MTLLNFLIIRRAHGMEAHRIRLSWSGEESRMNIFTIIGVVVVAILVAGYFGVHSVSF